MRPIGFFCALIGLFLGPALIGSAEAQTVPGAAVSLDALDPRRPLPLLPMMANHQKENMRGFLIAVQEVIAALGTDDFRAIQQTAGRIGYSEEMRQMCENMGAAAPGFTQQAIAFHKSVSLIGEAAREHNRARVVQQLGATLKMCTTCHATWKQQLIDEPTWVRLTSTRAHGPASMHGPEHEHMMHDGEHMHDHGSP